MDMKRSVKPTVTQADWQSLHLIRLEQNHRPYARGPPAFLRRGAERSRDEYLVHVDTSCRTPSSAELTDDAGEDPSSLTLVSEVAHAATDVSLPRLTSDQQDRFGFSSEHAVRGFDGTHEHGVPHLRGGLMERTYRELEPDASASDHITSSQLYNPPLDPLAPAFVPRIQFGAPVRNRNHSDCYGNRSNQANRRSGSPSHVAEPVPASNTTQRLGRIGMPVLDRYPVLSPPAPPLRLSISHEGHGTPSIPSARRTSNSGRATALRTRSHHHMSEIPGLGRRRRSIPGPRSPQSLQMLQRHYADRPNTPNVSASVPNFGMSSSRGPIVHSRRSSLNWSRGDSRTASGSRVSSAVSGASGISSLSTSHSDVLPWNNAASFSRRGAAQQPIHLSSSPLDQLVDELHSISASSRSSWRASATAAVTSTTTAPHSILSTSSQITLTQALQTAQPTNHSLLHPTQGSHVAQLPISSLPPSSSPPPRHFETRPPTTPSRRPRTESTDIAENWPEIQHSLRPHTTLRSNVRVYNESLPSTVQPQTPADVRNRRRYQYRSSENERARNSLHLPNNSTTAPEVEQTRETVTREESRRVETAGPPGLDYPSIASEDRTWLEAELAGAGFLGERRQTDAAAALLIRLSGQENDDEVWMGRIAAERGSGPDGVDSDGREVGQVLDSTPPAEGRYERLIRD